MRSKNKSFNFSILGLFILIGFLLGLTKAANEIISNRYLFHKMYFLILLSLKKHLNLWCIIFVLIGIISGIVLKRVNKIPAKKLFALSPVLIVPIFISVNFLCYSKKIDKPNVLIILHDALRADHLSVYGYSRDTSPNITAFAKDALVIDNVISQSSWTAPSVASLFTSFYPSVHGIQDYFGKDRNQKATKLNRKFNTIAETFRNEGFQTACFSTNSWVSSSLQFNQGFDTFELLKKRENIYKATGNELNKKALNWLDNNSEEPFFLYLHYVDTHHPYLPPEPYQAKFKSKEKKILDSPRMKAVFKHFHDHWYKKMFKTTNHDVNRYIDLYDGSINFIDDKFAELMKKLDSLNLTDNTIIIITSDHGEAFGEHENLTHQMTLYNEEIKVPLIIKFPETMKKFNNLDTSSGYIELIDLAPSLYDILGFKSDIYSNGKSFMNNDQLKEPCFSERTTEVSPEIKTIPAITIIKDGHKGIFDITKRHVTELYDLKSDPCEKNNLYNTDKQKCLVLSKDIINWTKERVNDLNKLKIKEEDLKSTELSKKDLDGLKGLGYIK